MNARVHDAFRDGVLDAAEQADLTELQEKLNLPPEVLHRLMAMNLQAQQRHNFCPHCGESLQDD